jgi:hypothetical protein
MAQGKKSPIGTVITLLVVAGGGAWYYNDSQAVDTVNAHVETVQAAAKFIQAKSGSMKTLFGDLEGEVTPHREALSEVIAEEGGQGPLPFLSRGEVKEAAAKNHLVAAATQPLLAVLLGDVEAARADVATYKEVRERHPEVEIPKEIAEMVGDIDKVVSTAGVEKVPPRALRLMLFLDLSPEDAADAADGPDLGDIDLDALGGD